VLEGEDTATITATLERTYGNASLGITLRTSGRRTVILNQEPLRRHLDLLGVLNTVQFSSLDLELVRGAPECRRDWLDLLLIQLEPVYAYILQQYQQILRQRNALLKAIRQQTTGELTSESFKVDTSQLSLWDEQLAAMGSRVTRRRARVLERLAPLAQAWHASISGKRETLEIKYAPNVSWLEDDPTQVQQAFLDKIATRRLVEQQQGKTVVGPHRDEVEFSINQTPARFYGSQGQQRTLVLALKLAELKLIEEVVGEPPLLLLDDVLAELDPKRQNQLLETIQDHFQTLITTTHLQAFDSQWLKASQILTVEAGKISNF
jgi:DNA replication and repair protein RecF